MTDTTKSALTGLAVGVVVGGAIILTADLIRSEEDRPPMVVKGGSLIIQSGVQGQVPGKPWRKKSPNESEWQMDHPQGKHTNRLFVAMSGSGSCGPAWVDSLTLHYRLEGTEDTREFQIVRKPPFGGGNRNAPTIVGEGLQEVPSTPDVHQLVFQSPGTFTRVTASGIDCVPAADVTIIPVK